MGVNGNHVIVRTVAKFRGSRGDDDRGKAKFLVQARIAFLDTLGTACISHTRWSYCGSIQETPIQRVARLEAAPLFALLQSSEKTAMRTLAEKQAMWLEEEKKHYEKWRVRALRFAEGLEHRIGDIGEYHYPGCGFHYAKQARIRKLLVLLAESLPNSYRDAVAIAIARKVILEVLATQVAEAEKYIIGTHALVEGAASSFADWVALVNGPRGS